MAQRLTLADRLAAAGLVLSLAAQAARAEAPYSLKNVEANPIPKAEHFLLWKEVVLNGCANAKERFNLTSSECTALIGKRADACASKLAPETPALISTTAMAKSVGRKYLQCATPFYFCNGVEVKTDAEARAQCK